MNTLETVRVIRASALEEAAQLVERYAVNLGAHGEHKTLILDERNGANDAVRQAYARAIRALGKA
jgi:hypothetical protein